MEFSKILSISKLGGLFSLVTKRDDGLIVKSLLEDKPAFFASSRSHIFTPLENITIYTQDGTEELINIFKEINSQKLKVDPKATNDQLKSSFEKVLPTYDTDKVYVSDIKKIFKWYSILDEVKLADKLFKKSVKKTTSNKKEDKGSDITTPTTKKAVKKTTKKTTSVKSTIKKPTATVKPTTKKVAPRGK